MDCSSGTYIRALARDLGAALGVGGHLTALRRTRIGPFGVDGAASIDDLGTTPLRDPADVASAVLGRVSPSRPTRPATCATASASLGAAARLDRAPAAAIDPAGALVGIVERRGDDVKSVMNLPEEAAR